MAAQEDHIDTVQVLLKHGADPHIPAKVSWSFEAVLSFVYFSCVL